MPESDNLNTVLLTDDEQVRYNLPTALSVAEVGYKAYGATTDHKNFRGEPMPTWKALPQPQRTAWDAASDALVQHTLRGQLLGVNPPGLEAINEGIKLLSSERTQQVSDGYHTFGELYDHRITLYIALCDQLTDKLPVWRSKRHSDGELAFGGGWFVLGIGIDEGKQITYHLPELYWNDCDFAETFVHAPEFDGHSSSDVLMRLKAL